MCAALMFLMKSTELHWSTGDESELSKAIRQVKDPLSAPCSTRERGTAAAREGAAAPPQAKGGEGAHVHIHFWRYRGVKSDKKIDVRYYRRTFCGAFRSVWCNNCWLDEAHLLHKPWLIGLHIYVILSSFCPPPRPPPLTSSMTPAMWTWSFC